MGIDLMAIKARRNEATIGPSWEAGGPDPWPEMFEEQAYVFPGEHSDQPGPICLASGLGRAQFIAAAPTDIDTLTDAVELLLDDLYREHQETTRLRNLIRAYNRAELGSCEETSAIQAIEAEGIGPADHP